MTQLELESPVLSIDLFPEISRCFAKNKVKPDLVWFAGYDWDGEDKYVRLCVNATGESMLTSKCFRQIMIPSSMRISQAELKRKRIASGEKINWELYQEFGEVLKVS